MLIIFMVAGVDEALPSLLIEKIPPAYMELSSQKPTDDVFS